ncbi:hypothetical protein J5U18_06820 [Sphingobacteriaceae bacterium WQ 2009]|uniref:Uncharacterized protein n=2 Tax=Rhinopithecimicrobium faecis TaxID=2820698 RepID=A0A8T4H912_9SPHI|nr:hypothetical protein [Sphingobacteriaceae bacterium WQ 2009]
MVKNAPYRYADFESVVYVYGTPDEMVNKYDSKTRIFQYLDKRDSLNIDTLKLNKDDLLYIHRKAQELGFWNLDDDMTGPAAKTGDTSQVVPRYYLELNYKDKSKKVTIDQDFAGNERMREAAKSIFDEVQRIIAQAHAR